MREPRSEHNPVQVSSEEALEKANRLAPLEERKGKLALSNSNDRGLIQVDTGALKVPNDFTERGEGKPRLFGLEPVTIFILIFSLAFIGFVAYLISIEPANAKDEAVPTLEQKP